MNILFVCSAKVWGGNEKWTSMTIAQCRALGHKVYFAGRKENLIEKFGETDGYIIPGFVNIFDVCTYIKLAKFIRKHHIDVIISTKKKEYVICGKLSRLMGIKHILRLGIVRKIGRHPFHWLIYKFLNDGIIVNAARTKKVIKETLFMQNHPVKLIYNGVHIQNIKHENDGKFHIFTSGMLIRRKGFHLLIKGLALLEDKENVIIHIAGDGDYKGELEALAKDCGMGDRVIFSGFVSDVTPFLARADLFVLLSMNEGISNSILEAMAASVPVFTTLSGGIEEFVTHEKNGFICHSPDPVSISRQLERILAHSDESLRTIGKNGQDSVRRMFSLERMGREVIAFLDEV